MCIIITKERGAKPLPKEIFSRCWDRNPDGAGILWNDGHTTTLTKGIMKKEDFMKKVAEVNKKENCFVIHTRIKTHGSVKPENTHPFVSKTLGFAHNGILNVEALPDTTDSETFFKWTIEDKTFEWCEENKFLLDMATNGSRCVIFNMLTGDMIHLCEEDWVKDEKYPGYWFSNKNYQSYEVQKTNYSRYNGYSSYYKGYDCGCWDDDDLWDYDYEATKNNYKKIDKEETEKKLKNINLIGTKRHRDQLNIDVKVVDEYIKINGEINSSSAAFADMARMIEELKKDEKSQLESAGETAYTYISTRLLRQWFGRAKSIGYTNVSEILIALEHYITDLKTGGDTLYTDEEKNLIKSIENDIDLYTDVYLEDMEVYEEPKEEKNVLSDKDEQGRIQKEETAKK